ncbi:MFS transporter [Dongia sp.]|uniref:MFS transporter n=1 Tax=Dongia sp. TaxID=1977262 RepID=UPI0035AFD504
MNKTISGAASVKTSPRLVVPVLGVTQILAWGSSYYLPAVLAQPIAADTGWSLPWIVGGLSLGLLTAGLAAPFIGRKIRQHGGRPVLAASALLLAGGLLGLSLAPNLGIFLLAWLAIGLGMGAGLYDPAFSTLGHIYGQGARPLIAGLTLFGGFASTACWPLSAFLAGELGWRGACLTYALIHLGISLPLYLFALPPGSARRILAAPPAQDAVPAPAPPRPPRATFILLAASIMIGATVSTVISVHLLVILQAQGLALAAAVALGALVGPSQVGARFIEMLIGRYHHPIWTKLASVSCVAIGLGFLWGGLPATFLALIFYGAGIGLESIARATLPLVLFGPDDYAPIMGQLARPSLIAQAAAPSVGALMLELWGAHTALGVVAGVALCNVLLAVSLYRRTMR